MLPTTASLRYHAGPSIKDRITVNNGATASSGAVKRSISSVQTGRGTYIRRIPTTSSRISTADVIEIIDSSDNSELESSDTEGTDAAEEDNNVADKAYNEHNEYNDDAFEEDEEAGTRKRLKTSRRASISRSFSRINGPNLLSTTPSSGGDKEESMPATLDTRTRSSSSSSSSYEASNEELPADPCHMPQMSRMPVLSPFRPRPFSPGVGPNRNSARLSPSVRSRSASTAVLGKAFPSPPNRAGGGTLAATNATVASHSLSRTARASRPEVIISVPSNARGHRSEGMRRSLNLSCDGTFTSDSSSLGHEIMDAPVAGPSRVRPVHSSLNAAQKGKGRAISSVPSNAEGSKGKPQRGKAKREFSISLSRSERGSRRTGFLSRRHSAMSSDLELIPVQRPAAAAIACERDTHGLSDSRVGSNHFKLITRAYDLDEEFECSICLDIMVSPVILSCGHTFCQSCVEPWLDDNHKLCPTCRETTSITPVRSYIVDAVIKKHLAIVYQSLEEQGKQAEADKARNDRTRMELAAEARRVAAATAKELRRQQQVRDAAAATAATMATTMANVQQQRLHYRPRPQPQVMLQQQARAVRPDAARALVPRIPPEVAPFPGFPYHRDYAAPFDLEGYAQQIGMPVAQLARVMQ